jgi:hypothetical protein
VCTLQVTSSSIENVVEEGHVPRQLSFSFFSKKTREEVGRGATTIVPTSTLEKHSIQSRQRNGKPEENHKNQ